MLKEIIKLKGVNELKKSEQAAITGGVIPCSSDADCAPFFSGIAFCEAPYGVGPKICIGIGFCPFC
ncbi:MAG: hypothetical protein AAF611_20030 [Bacteroidota bacterium]